jgi:D-sedoheptulose 7-phosphate isomerase
MSCSGTSPNVLAAAEVARRYGAVTIALTGRAGGQLRRLADLVIRVPAGRIEQVEDAHLAMAHSLCLVLRASLAAQAGSREALAGRAG